MKLRYFIPAVLWSLIIVWVQLLLPFAYDWYMAKLWWEYPPFWATIAVVFLSLGFVSLNIYAYIKAFED